jgi:hypothetical protein
MRFTNTTACISSLLMVTTSASTPTSFEIPGSAPGSAAAPEVDTTTVYTTSTYYVTSAVTMTSAPVVSTPAISAPTNSTTVMSSPCSDNASSPVEPVITPSVSLYVTDGNTFVPVTVWGPNSTVVVFPQNSTALEVPTGYPANSTVVVGTMTSASKTGTTSKDKTSATASTSASVSEVPENGASKVAGPALLSMATVAGFMALL